MSADHMTSTEVAALLGVSSSSVKRWAEEGVLPCVKTAGKHRRFERAVVERFRVAQTASAGGAAADPAHSWIEGLLTADDPQRLQARLLDERARLGSWLRVAESLVPVLEEIGERWAAGELTVLEEHLASERLARALGRVCEWIPIAERAPRALLATAEGDDHTLGLSLVEVCLRELGWRTLWAGRMTPTDELARRIATLDPPIALLAISASSASTKARQLEAQARRLGAACRTANVALTFGGAGRWPEVLRYGTRLQSLEALHGYARGLVVRS